MTIDITRKEANGEEGIEILSIEPYEENGMKGDVTKKIYHLKSKIPKWIRWTIPDKYLHIYETCYRLYPVTRTIFNLPGMEEYFLCELHSNYLHYDPSVDFPDNATNLNEDELKQRVIQYLDIVNGNPPAVNPEWDLHNFCCPEAGIVTSLVSPMNEKDNSKPPEWTHHYQGDLMVCVKTVKLIFKWKGLQTAVESYCVNIAFPEFIVEFQRKLLKQINEWFNLTMEEIKRLEMDLQKEQKKINFKNNSLISFKNPLTIQLIVGRFETIFSTLNSEIEPISWKINNEFLLNGHTYSIPNLSLFMFRSQNEPGLELLLIGTEFQFCQDPITKLVAISMKKDPTIIVTVEMIFLYLIEQIQAIIQDKLNINAESAIVLVPMMFTSAQRSDFQNCLLKSGLKNINFVDQTTTLATSIFESINRKEVALLGSWTESHLELSVSEIDSNSINILDKFGSFDVGLFRVKNGITRILILKMVDCNNKFPKSITDEEVILFNKYVDAIFHQLIIQSPAKIQVSITLSNFLFKSLIEISREEVEESCGHPYSTVEESIKKLIERNPEIKIGCFQGEGYDNPKSVERIAQKVGFQNIKIISPPNHRFNVSRFFNTNVKIKDCLYLSISIEAADDEDLLIFPRGTSLPTEEISQNLVTAIDFQQSMSINLAQGQRIDFSENFLIGEFSITNLPGALAEETTICCKFRIDEKGILSFKADIIGVNGSLIAGSFEMKREGQSELFSQEQILESRKYLKEDIQMLTRKRIIGMFSRFLENSISRLQKKYKCGHLSSSQINNLSAIFKENQKWLDKLDGNESNQEIQGRYIKLFQMLPEGFIEKEEPYSLKDFKTKWKAKNPKENWSSEEFLNFNLLDFSHIPISKRIYCPMTEQTKERISNQLLNLFNSFRLKNNKNSITLNQKASQIFSKNVHRVVMGESDSIWDNSDELYEYFDHSDEVWGSSNEWNGTNPERDS
jgi:hypothetical protein